MFVPLSVNVPVPHSVVTLKLLSSASAPPSTPENVLELMLATCNIPAVAESFVICPLPDSEFKYSSLPFSCNTAAESMKTGLKPLTPPPGEMRNVPLIRFTDPK